MEFINTDRLEEKFTLVILLIEVVQRQRRIISLCLVLLLDTRRCLHGHFSTGYAEARTEGMD